MAKKTPPEPVAKGTKRFRRARASRACEVCHSRKVRCDVTTRMPCTNCVAFNCECKVPKRNRRNGGGDSPISIASPAVQPAPAQPVGANGGLQPIIETTQTHSYDTPNANTWAKPKISGPETKGMLPGARDHADTYSNGQKVRNSQFIFYGPSHIVPRLLGDSEQGEVQVVTNSEYMNSSRDIDSEDFEVLKLKGAFLIPPKEVCDDLVESYFKWVHPIIPLINRNDFMRKYSDPQDPPSLLLLQCMFLAASKVCKNPALLDSDGSINLACLTFYKRAKSLYDSNYETDKVTIVQSLGVLGWWFEGPEDIIKNSAYWTRVAILVAQGMGMHRNNDDNPHLSLQEKRMWKRIWWSLFYRDRNIAVALGRPLVINTQDMDVKMITEDDFIEDEPDRPSLYPIDVHRIRYFIHSLKLSEIMGIILTQQYTASAQSKSIDVKSVAYSDVALSIWRKNLPDELKYHPKMKRSQKFFNSLLYLQYYTAVCLAHQLHLVKEIKLPDGRSGYPSRRIAFQASHMIARICGNLLSISEVKNMHVFYVYVVFTAIILLLYQTKSQNRLLAQNAQRSLEVCMKFMDVLGETWLAARMSIRVVNYVRNS
ncbi:hypothetical protein CANCADRAFT_26504, partial [Tortispora caseinolytica NRRL Y-17796]